MRSRRAGAGPAADRGGSEFAFVERLGRTHNAVVLPAGWALSACSVPGRVTLTDADRIRVDITNDRTDPAWLVLTGRPRGGR